MVLLVLIREVTKSLEGVTERSSVGPRRDTGGRGRRGDWWANRSRERDNSPQPGVRVRHSKLLVTALGSDGIRLQEGRAGTVPKAMANTAEKAERLVGTLGPLSRVKGMKAATVGAPHLPPAGHGAMPKKVTVPAPQRRHPEQFHPEGQVTNKKPGR